jgi:hypothetical protein
MICVYRSVTGRSPGKSSLVDSSEPSTKDRNNDNKMDNHERSKSRISRLSYITEQRFMCYKAVIRSGNTELSSSGIGQDTGKQRTHDHSENERYCARARTLDSSACKTHLCAPHACENKRDFLRNVNEAGQKLRYWGWRSLVHIARIKFTSGASVH